MMDSRYHFKFAANLSKDWGPPLSVYLVTLRKGNSTRRNLEHERSENRQSLNSYPGAM